MDNTNMRVNYFFLLLACFFSTQVYSEEAYYEFTVYPDYLKERMYIQLRIEQTGNNNYFLFSDSAYITRLKINDSLVQGYIQKNDTLFLLLLTPHIDKMEINYILPLKDYTTKTGAIILRKEGKWYPYQEQTLISSTVHTIRNADYYVISLRKENNDNRNHATFINRISNEIHLFFLPVNHFNKNIKKENGKNFYFYRNTND
jgi:hypothetical protein